MTEPVSRSYQLLSPLERAQYFNLLITRDGLTRTEVAKKCGRSLSYVSNTLRLLTLPEMIKEGLASSQISEGHARALLTIDDHQKMTQAYKEILLGNSTVRQAESIARRYN